jgi:hypothetical protein
MGCRRGVAAGPKIKREPGVAAAVPLPWLFKNGGGGLKMKKVKRRSDWDPQALAVYKATRALRLRHEAALAAPANPDFVVCIDPGKHNCGWAAMDCRQQCLLAANVTPWDAVIEDVKANSPGLFGLPFPLQTNQALKWQHAHRDPRSVVALIEEQTSMTRQVEKLRNLLRSRGVHVLTVAAAARKAYAVNGGPPAGPRPAVPPSAVAYGASKRLATHLMQTQLVDAGRVGTDVRAIIEVRKKKDDIADAILLFLAHYRRGFDWFRPPPQAHAPLQLPPAAGAVEVIDLT